jgi:uncharacterized membrane protein
MMDELALFGIAVAVLVLAGSVLGIVAHIRVRRLSDELAGLGRRLRALTERLDRLEEVLASGRSLAAKPAKPEAPAVTSREPEPVAMLVPEMLAPPPGAVSAEGPPLAPVPVAEEVPVGSVAPREAGERPAAAVARRGREWWKVELFGFSFDLPVVDFEKRVGERWLNWVGVVLLFFGVAFFIKYAMEHRRLGPEARVALGVLTGLVLLALGGHFVRRKMRAFGQGLMGGGLAILYLSLFAAFSLYHLIGQPLAFALMVLVTAAGMTLGVLQDAPALCSVAVLGGLLTPVLVSTGEDARDALFSYLVMLDLGVLAAALWRRWRVLELMAFAGTYLLYGGWFSWFYGERALVPALLWLGAFYVIFLCLPFLHELRQKSALTVDRFLVAMVNATVAFSFACWMLYLEHRSTLSLAAVGMGASYLVLGSLARWRIPADKRAALGFLTLAVTFLTVAVPLRLGLYGVTLVWSAEAVALVFLGYVYRYEPVRVAGFLVLFVALGRFLLLHWPLHEGPFLLFWNRPFATALCIPLAGAASALVHQWWRRESSPADVAFKVFVACAAGLLALVLIHTELALWIDVEPPLGSPKAHVVARAAMVCAWALGALAYAGAGVSLRNRASRLTALLPLLIALILSGFWYGGDSVPLPSGYWPMANGRFAAGLVAVVVAFGSGFLLERRRKELPEDEQFLGRALIGVGVLTLLVLLSLEAYRYAQELAWSRQVARWASLMALSLVWGLYAVALLAIGFWRRMRELRLAALALFGVTAAKLMLVDMSWLERMYRILSFVVLGLLMVGASYLYYRVEARLGTSAEKGP